MFEELFTERHTGKRLPFEHGTDRAIPCKILTKAESENAELYVHVQLFGLNARRGPCKWTPRPGKEGPVFPQGGEDAIMIFDISGLPWILQWWPA